MGAAVAHRLQLLQEGEAKLSPKHLALWRDVLALLPKDSPLVGTNGGWGLEMFLMKRIAMNWPLEALQKFIPKVVRSYDRKAAASGEAA